MESSNTFKYCGVDVNFNGFYNDMFCFYIIPQHKMVMIKNIEELKEYILGESINIKDNTEKVKTESELSIFWCKIAECLPKSFERSALGDEKIFRAFSEAYIEIKPIIFESCKDKIINEIKKLKDNCCDNGHVFMGYGGEDNTDPIWDGCPNHVIDGVYKETEKDLLIDQIIKLIK